MNSLHMRPQFFSWGFIMKSLKTLLIGFEGAAPEIWFEDERLVNLRRLMEAGCYGPLESVIPPSSVPAWLSLVTGQDPGSLGIYGPRNRTDRSYSSSKVVGSRTCSQLALRAPFVRAGGKTVFVGESPVSAPSAADSIDRVSLRDEAVALTCKNFAEVRQVLEHGEWDFLQFIVTGLDRLQHAFWKDHDPAHPLHDPDSPHLDVIRDTYLLLDGELGSLLELLDEQTMVLAVSTHGAQSCQGAFCVNQWLMGEGLLTLRNVPGEITPFDRLDIDWSKTKVWSEGGNSAQLHFNVKGREPAGIVDWSELEALRADVKSRLEAITDFRGGELDPLVLAPEKIYHSFSAVAPDLIAQFGRMTWRAVDGVGYSSLQLKPDEVGGHTSSPTSQGAFVLAVPGLQGAGLIEGVSLLDIAPTLLEINGGKPLTEMQGRSLLGRAGADRSSDTSEQDDDERLIRERLSGLGYLG